MKGLTRAVAAVAVVAASSLSGQVIAEPDTESTKPATASGNDKNVLFIIVDDLQPLQQYSELGGAYTPNLDQFGSESFVFHNAHAQFAMCGPSRASLLTGLLPSTTNIYNNVRKTQICDIRRKQTKRGEKLWTLNEAFTNFGYHTEGIGKIYHRYQGEKHGSCGSEAAAIENRWSVDPLFEPFGAWRPVEIDENGDATLGAFSKDVPIYEFLDVKRDQEDQVYLDMNATAQAVARLTELFELDKRWFFVLGLRKPHLPYLAPKRFLDLFEGYEIEPPSRYISKDLSRFKATFTESSLYRNKINPPHDKDKMRVAYFATVAYIDEQIGRVLDLLERKNQVDDTIVVITSDHGFHPGEHGFWAKHNCLDNAIRVPLMIRDTRFGTGSSHAPTELLDIFPTLVDLTGNEMPSDTQRLEGKSLRPIMDGSAEFVKPLARSFWVQGFGTRSFRGVRHRVIEKAGKIVLIDYKEDPRELKNAAVGRSKGDPVKLLRNEMRRLGVDSLEKEPDDPTPLDADSTGAYVCCYNLTAKN